MARYRLGRPSASLVIACLALFVALGGVGYAAATIDSGDIVDDSIRSKDVKNRGLRGKDVRRDGLGGGVIKETTLGQVPTAANATNATNATNAASATNAANADTLDGLDSGAFATSGHDHDGRYYTETEVDGFLSALRFIETGNGVGGNFGCPGTTLGVQITDGRGTPVDDRFTFQVPNGANPSHGQIRSDGSLRSGNNVAPAGATHTPGTGVYCVPFVAAPGALESAVVSIHLN
jgi:hypothetical protein